MKLVQSAAVHGNRVVMPILLYIVHGGVFACSRGEQYAFLVVTVAL